MPLERSGLSVVVENASRAVKDLNAYSSAVDRARRANVSAEKQGGLTRMFRGIDKGGPTVTRFTRGLTKVSDTLRDVDDLTLGMIPSLSGLASKFNVASIGAKEFSLGMFNVSASALAATAAVAALAVGLVAIVKLGSRGAQLQQTAAAFGNIVSDAGDSTEVLSGLRRATAGMISDFELMRLTTLSLAGQQREFRQELLSVGDDGTTALGRIVDATNRIAQATGLNEEVVREKFLTGLRLQSRLRLDDVGVAVDQAEANRRYAESIGATADALTEQQQKAAFAREAIRQLDEIMVSFGDRSTILRNMARPMVALRNVLDKLSVAAVPAFAPLAKLAADAASAFESLANLAFPIITRLSELIGNVLTTAFNLVGFALRFSFLGVMAQIMAPIMIHIIALITLMLDGLNALFAPLNSMVDGVERLAGPAMIFGQIGSALQSIANFLGPVLNPAFRIMVDILLIIAAIAAAPFFLIAEALQTIIPFAQGAATTLMGLANTITGAVSAAAGRALSVIGSIAAPIISVGKTIGSALASVLKSALNIIQTMIQNFIPMVGMGGGAIIGAFAAGLLRGAANVTQAVTVIATIIADFLQGFSPPKRGPLSRIDEGGFNVARTWAEGFKRGFLRPREIVDQQITETLGSIGDLIAEDVEKRIKGLEIALLPFNEQLDIAKARVEEIAGFTEPALRAIERQRKEALRAFGRGEGSAEEVRQLDRQLEQLRAIKKQGDAMTDQAEIELAFAKSQQSVELAMLEIQKRRLGLFGKEAVAAAEVSQAIEASGGGAGSAVSDAVDTAAKKAAAGKKPGGGGGGGPEEGITPGAGLTTGDAPDLLANAAVDNAREGILGFVSGLPAGLQGITQSVSEAGGLLGEGFATGFASSGFDEALGEFNSNRGELQTQIDRISSADPAGRIAEKFSGLTEKITAPFSQAAESVAQFFGEGGALSEAISGAFGEGGFFGPGGTISNAITGLFGEESPLVLALGPAGTILPMIETFVDLAVAAFDRLKTEVDRVMLALPDSVRTPLSQVRQAFNGAFNSAISPVRLAVNNIRTMIADIVTALTDFAGGGLLEALRPLPGNLWDAMLAPFVSAVNGIIQTVQNAINGALSALPGFLRDEIGLSDVNLGSVEMPARPDGFARGGLNVSGLAMVGERGPELVRFSRPSNILPTDPTRALMEFFGGSSSVVSPGSVSNSNVTNNNQRTFNNTFNNTSPQDSILLLREMEALQ